MKRVSEALVRTKLAAVAVAVAVAGLCGTAGAQAASPVVRLRGDASLKEAPAATSARFHVAVAFNIRKCAARGGDASVHGHACRGPARARRDAGL
jgi:hypothetical protein